MHRPAIVPCGAFDPADLGAPAPPAVSGAPGRAAAIGVLVFLAFLSGASAEELFRDVTSRTGVGFVHVCGSAEKDWIVEVNGSGVALLDHDGDGDLDIYFVNGSRLEPAGETDGPPPRNALYRNDGDWRFTDVTAAAGVGDDRWGSGAAVADIDNDGHLDLYVTNRGPNVLYRNRGDGTFERLGASGAEDPRWSIGASFADFDRDGLVDLYVANYIEFRPDEAKRRGAPECAYKGVPIFCGPGGLEPAPDSLFLNEGGGGFRDVSDSWGIRRVEPSYGMGTLVLDVERDGWPDIVVANDTQRNFCFVNRKGRGFSEAGLFLGLAYNDYGVEQAGMGLASGDIRGIGRDDVFVTNFEDDTNTLYLSDREGLYTEGTFPAGLGEASYPYLGWGTFFFDADGDGDLDLFVANGHVAPQADRMPSSPGYRQRNQLFLGDGRGKFRESRAFAARAESRKRSSRGAASGDLDGDGDADIVVTNIDGPPAILENRSRASWVVVRLRGTSSNRAAVGARVALITREGRRETTIQSGASYASQCELVARFGVSGGPVESVEVAWPRGLVERFPPPRPGETTVLVEGEGEKP